MQIDFKEKNSVIIKIAGGLGNQMFQYAFYQLCIDLGYNASIDISYYDKNRCHNGFELIKIFSIDAKYANPNLSEILGDFNNNVYNRFRRALIGNRKSLIKESNFSYEKLINLAYDNVYFNGYWQNELFFKNISDSLRKDFKFQVNINELSISNKSFLEEISNGETVSLHIRRGDYLNIPLHNGCCTEEYYLKAIQKILELHENVKFFIFSDDIEWCMKIFDNITPIYVSGNATKSSFLDMFLMSKCKHNIIANSTFSWWSAWLNENSNKTVICPRKWFNNETINNDYVTPESWFKI